MNKYMKRFLIAFVVSSMLASPAFALEDVFSRMGKVYDLTRTVPTTDNDQVFTAAYDVVRGATSDWTKVKAVLIQCKTNNAIYAWKVATNDATPTTAFTLYVGSSLYLTDAVAIQTLHIGSEAAGSAAALVTQLFY